MADDTPTHVPKGRLRRFSKLARAGARAGSSILLGSTRSPSSTAKSAEKMASLLGDMRALGAKVGQMLAYVDGVLPPDQQAIFAHHLKPLLEHTPTSSTDQIEAVITHDLGAPLTDLFSHFEPVPIASASIGQVHRATLPDGTEVAVKVQHPGIDEALRQDLDNLSAFEGILGVVGGKFGAVDLLREARDRFLEELDYHQEAKNQNEFNHFFRDNPHIIVPDVIASRCGPRVLTTRFVHGHSFDQAAAATEPERAAWCATLWRFVYEATLIGHMFNADPHPGNYRFAPDGEVIFFDFGCVQRQSPERSALARRAHWAAIHLDEPAFFDACRALMGLRGGQWEAAALDYMRLCFEPQFSSPFRMDRDYVRQVVGMLQELKFEAMRIRDDSFVPLQEGMLFVNRLQFGFYSVLAALDVTVDYASIERSYLQDSMGDPLTP